MTRQDDPRTELLGIAERLRHLRAEHTRAHADGAVRRKLEAEMAEVSEHLERRLANLVPDEADREAWRAHAHHGAAAPERPEAAEAVAAAGGTPPDRPSGRRPWPR
jgi:hypothetical protein